MIRQRDVERFNRYVDRTPGLGPQGTCWHWTAPLNRGYGQFNVDGRPRGAHRVAYAIAHGTLPAVVRHACDNPQCVRPDHLLAGTHADNVADRVARGRTRTGHKYGIEHHNARLTPAKVRYIRESTKTLMELGEELGIDHSTVSQVRRRVTWRNVA